MTLCGHGLWAQGERELLQALFIKFIDLDWIGQGIRVEGRYPSLHSSSTVLSLSTNSSLQWIWDHTHIYRWASEKKKLWNHLVGIYPRNHGVSPFGNSLCRLCHPVAPGAQILQSR